MISAAYLRLYAEAAGGVPADARGNAAGAIVRGGECQMSLGAGAILRDSKNPLFMRVAGGFCQNADL